MLLSSPAGAAPQGGANEIWEDYSGSVEAVPVDPTSGSLDWQSLGSSELDDGARAGSLGADDVLLTPTLDRFLESLDNPDQVDGSQLPEGRLPDGTVSDPMNFGKAACEEPGGNGNNGNHYGWYKDKDKDKDDNGNGNDKDKDDDCPPAGPVPEPSTLLLAGASALAFGARKRFRTWRRKGQENATDA
jgi:hypothetical protein